MSKGSKPRPYNKSTFNHNFDRIFGNGRDKGSDITDSDTDRGDEQLAGEVDADNPPEASS
jgi:hypothetical protein